MPEFTELDDSEKIHLHFLKTYQRKKREFQIRTALANAIIRLSDAICPLLDQTVKDDALLLSEFMKKSAIAYVELSRLIGATRFCEYRILLALSVLEEGV